MFAYQGDTIGKTAGSLSQKKQNTALPVTQFFRLLTPQAQGVQQIVYNRADRADMFTTHQIVNDRTGNQVRGNMNLQRPSTGFLGWRRWWPWRPRPGAANANAVGMDAGLYNALDNAATQAANAPNNGNWNQYFQQLGKTAEPQLPGNTLGQTPYDINIGNAKNAGNVLDANSKFYVKPVATNVQVPMLVSTNDEFAINAVYSDPKEAYLSANAMAKANANLANPNPTAAAKALQTSAKLLQYNNTVTIGGKLLHMCRPQFSVKQAKSLESAATHACDEMRRNYYSKGPQNQVLSGNNLNVGSNVPWGFHVAGVLCNDGADTLSLENGARNTWLVKRGQNTNHAMGLAISQDNAIQEELKKTWYFRMYGPQNLGQDIDSQTKSRF